MITFVLKVTYLMWLHDILLELAYIMFWSFPYGLQLYTLHLDMFSDLSKLFFGHTNYNFMLPSTVNKKKMLICLRGTRMRSWLHLPIADMLVVCSHTPSLTRGRWQGSRKEGQVSFAHHLMILTQWEGRRGGAGLGPMKKAPLPKHCPSNHWEKFIRLLVFNIVAIMYFTESY